MAITSLIRRPTWCLALGVSALVAACGQSTTVDSGPPVKVTVGASPTSTPSLTPSTADTPGADRSSKPTGPAPTNIKTVSISLANGKVSPAPQRIELRKGEKLTLKFLSDHDDAIHVHGFEVERQLSAQVPAQIQLTGGAAGIFDVESHHPELKLLQIVVR